MNTRTLERFAQEARRQLHSQIAARLDRVLTTDSADLRAKARTVADLQRQVKEHGKQSVVERVAYTWFNRFCALRYMDVNRYTRTGILSPAATVAQGEAYTQPEILQEAKAGVIDSDVEPYVDAQAIFDLLNGRVPSADAQSEAYRLLLVGACNAYHAGMPFLFEPIDDYTELLMPEDLLSQSSIVQAVRDALTPDACADVEVIGWLYQFYISEKKDQVIGSKAKIKAADIPAATQLFTPHWIVRYLVENSLGRLWMLNRPNSRLVERMEYYIAPESYGHEVGRDLNVYGHEVGRAKSSPQQEDPSPPHLVPLPIASPEEIRLCDPAVGSGHMLTYAFDLLYAIYEEEGYPPSDIPRLILTKNLYGMEIDERVAALAAFALTMKARAKDRRFLSRSTRDNIRPNICVLHPIALTEQELKPEMERLAAAVAERYGHEVGRETPSSQQDAISPPHLVPLLLHDLTLFTDADNFGSLLRPQLSPAQIRAAAPHSDADAAGQIDRPGRPCATRCARRWTRPKPGAALPRGGGEPAVYGEWQRQWRTKEVRTRGILGQQG